VGRRRVHEQIAAATRPALGSGEYIRSCSAVWATECGGKVPLLFRGRSLHYLAVTDQRLILFRPRRRAPLQPSNMLIAKRHSTFKLEKSRKFSPMLQLVVRDAGNRQIALEFRPRDRKAGRDLADQLGWGRRQLPRGDV
jgi:hypothetical protein